VTKIAVCEIFTPRTYAPHLIFWFGIIVFRPRRTQEMRTIVSGDPCVCHAASCETRLNGLRFCLGWRLLRPHTGVSMRPSSNYFGHLLLYYGYLSSVKLPVVYFTPATLKLTLSVTILTLCDEASIMPKNRTERLRVTPSHRGAFRLNKTADRRKTKIG